MKFTLLLLAGAGLASLDFARLYRKGQYGELITALLLLLFALPLAGKLIWSWPVPSPSGLLSLLGRPINHLLDLWFGPLQIQ